MSRTHFHECKIIVAFPTCLVTCPRLMILGGFVVVFFFNSGSRKSGFPKFWGLGFFFFLPSVHYVLDRKVDSNEKLPFEE